MSLVFAAITPHSPLLIPSIGKEHLSQLTKTVEAYKRLEEDLYASKAETIIIISPHGLVKNDAFTLNLAPEFEGNLEEFGDFSTKNKYAGDVGLAYQIREDLETKAALQLTSNPKLDHGSYIPLSLLTGNIADMKIIPISYSNLNLEAHLDFGRALKKQIVLTQRRVAVIASGDLSHCLTKEAPGGYSPKAEKFDNKICELLQKHKVSEILSMNPELITEAQECGLRSILILLGILDGFKAVPQRLAYEAPYGVGYLTMKYQL